MCLCSGWALREKGLVGAWSFTMSGQPEERCSLLFIYLFIYLFLLLFKYRCLHFPCTTSRPSHPVFVVCFNMGVGDKKLCFETQVQISSRQFSMALGVQGRTLS